MRAKLVKRSLWSSSGFCGSKEVPTPTCVSHCLYVDNHSVSNQEKEELIEDWRPEPLVPEVDPEHPVLQDMENRLIDGYIKFSFILMIFVKLMRI